MIRRLYFTVAATSLLCLAPAAGLTLAAHADTTGTVTANVRVLEAVGTDGTTTISHGHGLTATSPLTVNGITYQIVSAN